MIIKVQGLISRTHQEIYKYEDFDKMNRDREMIGLPRLPKEIGFSIK